MTDKPESKNGYTDFQSALESVGTEAMEQAINTAFQQIMADEAAAGPAVRSEFESPEGGSSPSGQRLKQVPIESVELAIAETVGALTGESYRCSIHRLSFEVPDRVNIDLTLAAKEEE